MDNLNKIVFASEFVAEGHPDKVCDQISDGILDAIISNDAKAHVEYEVAITDRNVFVMGEITTRIEFWL